MPTDALPAVQGNILEINENELTELDKIILNL
jgi:hypothetical protein